MKTFKQFLESDNPLEDVQIEMILRHTFGFTQTQAEFVRAWYQGEDDIELSLDLDVYYKLIDYWSDEMPYDVAKGKGNISADDWIHHALDTIFTKEGI